MFLSAFQSTLQSAQTFKPLRGSTTIPPIPTHPRVRQSSPQYLSPSWPPPQRLPGDVSNNSPSEIQIHILRRGNSDLFEDGAKSRVPRSYHWQNQTPSEEKWVFFKIFSLHKGNISKEILGYFPTSILQFNVDTTCLKTSEEITFYRKPPWYFSRRLSATKPCYRAALESCLWNASTEVSWSLMSYEMNAEMFYCYSFEKLQQNARALFSSRPTPHFFHLVFQVPKAGGKGAARRARPEEKWLACINRASRQKPNAGSNRKAHMSNTSLEAIKQNHRQIDTNQNQPKGIISQTNASVSKGLILSKLLQLQPQIPSNKQLKH